MPDQGLDTPVALLVFNRPATTQRVFDAVARARPRQLLMVADGPRTDRPGEVEKCREVRKLVQKVDWPCEVLTHFADQNLGCRRRISSGLDWVFSQVPEAIILEDDCLPSASFFPYCSELLARYRDDPRVMMISGDNFLLEQGRPEASYYFSRRPHIWGWASWARAWKKYDVNMSRWPELRDTGWLESVVGKNKRLEEWQRELEATWAGKIDTWDYQWFVACWLHEGLSIAPAANLVQNIGYGAGASHTHDSDAWESRLVSCDLALPLRHPAEVKADQVLDALELKIQLNRGKTGSALSVWAQKAAVRWSRSLKKRLDRLKNI